jgi:hypothetical protein
LLGVEGQTLTGGVAVTPKDLGTQSSGTLTLDMGDRAIQKLVNNGAFTLAPGTVKGSIILEITNGASAGSTTVTGFDHVAGDDLDTIDTNRFLAHVTVADGGSQLLVEAQQ